MSFRYDSPFGLRAPFRKAVGRGLVPRRPTPDIRPAAGDKPPPYAKNDALRWAVAAIILMAALLTSCQYVPVQPHPLVGEGEPPGYIDGQIPAKYRGLRNPFSLTDQAAIAAGSLLYNSYQPSCANCHGFGGQGDGALWPRMEPMPPSFGAPPLLTALREHQDYVYWWVSEGVVKTVMPAYSRMSETQRWQVITLAWFLGEQAAQNPINRDQYRVSRPLPPPFLRSGNSAPETP